MWIRIPKVASSSMSQALGPKARSPGWDFAFVRHPWDRLYSTLKMLAPNMSIEAAYHRHANNYHLLPQSDILEGFEPDFIGKYEQLDRAWQTVMARLGVGPLEHLNKGQYDGHWTDHDWTPYLPRYLKDFEQWNYSTVQ